MSILIASGETSGQLENMLERAANNQDNDISQLIETSLCLFEPAIIFTDGCDCVVYCVGCVAPPIFSWISLRVKYNSPCSGVLRGAMVAFSSLLPERAFALGRRCQQGG